MKGEELKSITDLTALVRDLTEFISQALHAEYVGRDYPHRPGDEAQLGERMTMLGLRLQARFTDATGEAPPETIGLVGSLRAASGQIEQVPAGLLAGSLSPEKQHEFAALLTSLGELLHEHADARTPPTDTVRRQALEDDLLRETEPPPPP